MVKSLSVRVPALLGVALLVVAGCASPTHVDRLGRAAPWWWPPRASRTP